MVLTVKLCVRIAVAILVGFAVGYLVASVLGMGVAELSHSFELTRDDLITNDRNALDQRVNVIWTGSLVGLALACAVGAVAGSWVAARIAPRSNVARTAVVGAVLLLGTVQALLMVGHPFWVAGVAVVLFLFCIYVSHRLASPGGS